MDSELRKNLDKLHTTELGVERIKRNWKFRGRRDLFHMPQADGAHEWRSICRYS